MPLTIRQTADYILVNGDGLSSLSEAQQHFRDLSALLVATRKSGRREARLMIDLRTAVPHPPEVASHIEQVLPVLYKRGDRVAVLVQSSALKVQTQTSHSSAYTGVFLTEEAAEQYLARTDM